MVTKEQKRQLMELIDKNGYWSQAVQEFLESVEIAKDKKELANRGATYSKYKIWI